MPSLKQSADDGAPGPTRVADSAEPSRPSTSGPHKVSAAETAGDDAPDLDRISDTSTSAQEEPALRVCYFGTYRAAYSRNRIMMEGLRRNGVTVLACHETLWHGVEDRVRMASGGWRSPAFWGRIFRTYSRLLQRYWRMRRDYDVMVVGYPGQFDVFLARVLSWWQGKPLVWDIFMSIYLISLERNLESRSRRTVQMLHRVERLACRLPDLLIQDTADYVDWFVKSYGVPPDRFRLVPTGADSRRFHPPAQPVPAELGPFDDEHPFQVIYYGSFIPNHGVATVVEAARLLEGRYPIQFTLIGAGPEKTPAQELAAGLTNICFRSWMPVEKLVQTVAGAHLCLGAFGVTPQSLMTIQNKIYECLAMGKPVITGESPAVRSALRHGEEIYLCRRTDAQDLAGAVATLYGDPALRQRLAEQGRAAFLANYSVEQIGRRFAGHLAVVAATHGGAQWQHPGDRP